jgi:uncharacterized phage-associated protein
MATAYDVAAYILQQKGEMTTWKLQKLVYYSQAWHLVWADAPLFADRIEAWANGPVVRSLYGGHRGDFTLTRERLGAGNPENLTEQQKTTIDAVLTYYGDKTGQWLSELTHSEPPWRNAREGMAPTERGNRAIELNDMAEYYGGL